MEQPFNVSERAKSLGKTIGSAIYSELATPITGWIHPYVQTAVCDGIAHELRRVKEALKDCPHCLETVEKIATEAYQQRFLV